MTKHETGTSFDSLTNLAKHDGFAARTRHIFAEGNETGRPLSILALDLDQLKAVNETFGSAMGDRVITVLADSVRTVFHPSDITARIAGDEFAAVLPGRDGKAAMTLARQVRDVFQDRAWLIDGMRVEATVSVGVATFRRPTSTLGVALAQAQGALGRAKALGRGRILMAGHDASQPSTGVAE